VRIRTRLAGLFLIALASVALAACGGGSSGGDAKSLLSDGFSKPIPKATIALNVSATLQGVPGLTQPVSLKLNGPYESRGKNKVPKFDFDVAISGGGQSFTGKLISTGDNAFVGLSGQNYEVGQQAFAAFEQQLASKTTQANGKTLKQLGIDPQSWITNPKTQGDEDVAGTKTTKVTGTFNAEKFIRDLNSVAGKASGAVGTAAPQKLTEAQIKQFSQAVKDPKFEIFVAKGDKTIRKITASLQFAVPAAQRTQTQGVSGGSVQFSIQFSNVGQPAQVTAPTGAKPLQNLIDQIKSLTTGSTGSSGSSGSGSGSGSNSGSGSGSSGSASGGASTAQYQKYAACVSKAGSDQTAAAKCLDLLK
jgi:hypothetical protein